MKILNVNIPGSFSFSSLVKKKFISAQFVKTPTEMKKAKIIQFYFVCCNYIYFDTENSKDIKENLKNSNM